MKRVNHVNIMLFVPDTNTIYLLFVLMSLVISGFVSNNSQFKSTNFMSISKLYYRIMTKIITLNFRYGFRSLSHTHKDSHAASTHLTNDQMSLDELKTKLNVFKKPNGKLTKNWDKKRIK